MNNKKLALTEENICRYYDGQMDKKEREELEALISASPEARALLEKYSTVSRMMGALGTECIPDEFTAHRNWEAISSALEKKKGRSYRRLSYWVTLAAAAIILIFLYGPLPRASANELVVESIDCTYSSFMLLKPETGSGHTIIIWIEDNGDKNH
jgi:anti-sigma factor RsiW